MSTSITIRAYRDPDGPAVRSLLDETLGESPTVGPASERFAWKHMENHFGRSLMLVAEADGRIVGLRAFMRWEFAAGGRPIRAVRAVDTATAPAYQGRGIFSRLTLEALEDLREDVDLVFNTPNERSGAGYLKMGWRSVGRVDVDVRIRRPVRFIRGLALGGTERPPPDPAGRPVAEVLEEGAGLEELLRRAASTARLATRRSVDYLRWRYGAAPRLDYRAAVARDGGRPRGLGVFRVRQRGGLRECSIAELIVAPGDRRTARGLLRQIVRSTRTDHLLAIFPPASAAARAGRRSGFVRRRRGPVLMVNPLRSGIVPDPLRRESWELSVGDLEVF